MKNQDYTASITVNNTAEKVFNNINNIPGWWTKCFEGHSGKLNEIFTVSFGETFITIQITELIPYRKIGWRVIDCFKHWLKDKQEWQGTEMVWEISPAQNETKLQFTHTGLVPGIECYEGCEKAWDFYINKSLFKLLTDGKGIPELK